MVEADALIDTVLPRGLADVRQDRCAVDDRLRPRPRTERVAEREHVGVRADAREPKQIPRPPDCSSRLEDREALLRAVLLQPTCGADTGDTGTYDQDVDVFARRHGSTARGVYRFASQSNGTLVTRAASTRPRPHDLRRRGLSAPRAPAAVAPQGMMRGASTIAR